MHKTVRDIVPLGSKAVINGQQYSADETMFVGTSEKMCSCIRFVQECGIDAVFEVDIQTNKIFPLQQELKQIFSVCKELHQKRLATTVSEVIQHKSDSFIDLHKDLSAFIETYSKEKPFFPKISICGKDYKITWYSLKADQKGDSLIVAVSDGEMAEGLSVQSFHHDIEFVLTLADDELMYQGSVVRVERLSGGYLMYVQPYPMEIIQSTRANRTIFENIDPFSVLDFIFNKADTGVTGVVYPHSDEKPINNYLIVGVLKNIDITIEDCVIGPVRVGKKIDASSEFAAALSSIEEPYTVVWVNVDANSHYNAFLEGKKTLVASTEFLSFLLKNDLYTDWFGAVELNNKVWDVRSHYPKIYLETLFYVENCITSEAITLTDESVRAPSAICLDENAEYLLDYDWIETFFRKTQEKNKKILRLQYAIKWIVQAWAAEDPYDKVIYCSTALEFVVNGEKGTNILDEYASLADRPKFTKKERSALINQIAEEAKIEELNGFSEELLAQLNESVKKMISNKLTEVSFATKLDQLIDRLDVPVRNEEKDLLKRARSIRNELIHGIEMSSISTSEMKKLCGVTSRILMYKLIDQLKEG